MSHEIFPFEAIRRTNPAGNKFWSSRDFARVLGYVNYRHFLAMIEKSRTARFNSGQQVEDHFVGITEMIEIGVAGPGLSFLRDYFEFKKTARRPKP